MMKRLLGALALVLFASAAQAQATSAIVVTTCGTPPATYVAGQPYPLTVDTTGKLCDGASGGAGSPSVVGVAQTIYTFSTLNTSSAQLGAGASFTGTIEPIPNEQVISVMLTADQPVTVTIKQYIDAAGVFAVTPIVITAAAGQTINQAVLVNGNYLNVVAQNMGSGTTTTFNLNVAYGPNPTAVTKLGNVGVGVAEPLPAGSNAIGAITNTSFAATQATAASLNATVVGTGAFAVQNTAATPAGTNLIGLVTSVSSGAVTNPTSTLTSGTATAITATNNEIASSTTAGSIVIPSFAIATSAGGAIIPKMTMQTSAASGWGGASIQVDLWRAAPTLTNGDGAVYLPATGSASFIGSYTCTLAQAGDGAYGECTPNAGQADFPKLASGTSVFWTAFSLSTVTKASGQTFVLTAAVLN